MDVWARERWLDMEFGGSVGSVDIGECRFGWRDCIWIYVYWLYGQPEAVILHHSEEIMEEVDGVSTYLAN